ncbi:MAG: hypothetical protein E7595_04090 [Ruminococcaceae bacterium]|nr:hypothetical protein [Oscillospiraceae bacterium]
MRLFHVSEESDINIFNPRVPLRADMDKSVGVVWALDEKRLPNFLTPRDCPRVCYHIGPNTTEADIREYFPDRESCHAVVIERDWLERMKNTVLYIYEFDPKDFVLQDDVAGYYIATVSQTPIAVHRVDNLLGALAKAKVELVLSDYLWEIAERIKNTGLNWSLCRMKNAKTK